MGGSLLIVDDDAVLRERLARALRGRGFEVAEASCFDHALALARVTHPEKVVLDLRGSSYAGRALIQALRALEPAMQVLIWTAYGPAPAGLGAVRYLRKPADADDILHVFAQPSLGGSTRVCTAL